MILKLFTHVYDLNRLEVVQLLWLGDSIAITDKRLFELVFDSKEGRRTSKDYWAMMGTYCAK